MIRWALALMRSPLKALRRKKQRDQSKSFKPSVAERAGKTVGVPARPMLAAAGAGRAAAAGTRGRRMRIERRFTKDGQSPYAEIEFRLTASEIKNPDGSVVFSDAGAIYRLELGS